MLAVIVIINAFNLIDGINALSATIGCIVCTAFGYWFFCFAVVCLHCRITKVSLSDVLHTPMDLFRCLVARLWRVLYCNPLLDFPPWIRLRLRAVQNHWISDALNLRANNMNPCSFATAAAHGHLKIVASPACNS